jgi:hypothetical protein
MPLNPLTCTDEQSWRPADDLGIHPDALMDTGGSIARGVTAALLVRTSSVRSRRLPAHAAHQDRDAPSRSQPEDLTVTPRSPRAGCGGKRLRSFTGRSDAACLWPPVRPESLNRPVEGGRLVVSDATVLATHARGRGGGLAHSALLGDRASSAAAGPTAAVAGSAECPVSGPVGRRAVGACCRPSAARVPPASTS